METIGRLAKKDKHMAAYLIAAISSDSSRFSKKFCSAVLEWFALHPYLSIETQIEHSILGSRKFRLSATQATLYVGILRLLSPLSQWNSDIPFLKAVDNLNYRRFWEHYSKPIRLYGLIFYMNHDETLGICCHVDSNLRALMCMVLTRVLSYKITDRNQ